MKRKTTINLILFFVVSLALITNTYAAKNKGRFSHLKGAKAPICSIKIVNVYPHDSLAFTQGLIYRGGFLYESTGLRGKSSLRKVELRTGIIVQEVKLSEEYFGEGITFLDNKIYQLTYTSEVGFVYDFEKLKIIKVFKYEGEGWGITTNGKYLFTSDGSSVITCREVKSFDAIKKINVHDGNRLISRINEVEYIKGEIWANVFITDVIACISPLTGEGARWVDLRPLYSVLSGALSADVLNGIAYDEVGDKIFATGKYWPYIFEIEVY